MKNIILLLMCIFFLSSCTVYEFNDNFHNDDFSLSTSEITVPDNFSNNPINISAKIYKAKATTSYSRDMLFPESSQNSINYDSYFYFSALSNELKPSYATLCAAIENMADGFIDLGYFTDEDISLLITSIKYDRPEYFWLGRDYIINTKSDGFKQIAFKFKSQDYTIDYLYTPQKRNEISSNIKAVISGLEKRIQNKSEFEKELIIHDFVVNNCSYNNKALNDAENNESSYNIYGAILLNRAVCEGYSKAIQLLNNHFGIKTTVLTGSANNQNHMWNLVMIDGDYYHLDSTFNDGENTNLYAYFNLSETAIKRTHKIDANFYKNLSIPKANNTEKSYFNFNNSMIKDEPSQDIQEAIYYAIDSGKTSVDFGYSDTTTKIYKNNNDMLKDNIDIIKTINSACKSNKTKAINIKIIFAANGNFKLIWEYKK